VALALTLRALEMATELADAHNLPHDMRSTQARDLMRSLRFDQAPVMRRGRLAGWVRTATLTGRGSVEQHLTALEDCAILARDTHVSDAIKAVAKHQLVFLAGPAGINAFVVASDLDRHAVRCYLYVLVSELEMYMASQAAASLSTEQIEIHLGNQTKRYRQAQQRGVETHPIEYLNFSSYGAIALLVPTIVDRFPGDRDSMASELENLKTLRDCVAHPSKSLTLDFEATELARLTQLAEHFVAALRPETHAT
jgi:hypothetical protein